jgi:hypothetical protein
VCVTVLRNYPEETNLEKYQAEELRFIILGMERKTTNSQLI